MQRALLMEEQAALTASTKKKRGRPPKTKTISKTTSKTLKETSSETNVKMEVKA